MLTPCHRFFGSCALFKAMQPLVEESVTFFFHDGASPTSGRVVRRGIGRQGKVRGIARPRQRRVEGAQQILYLAVKAGKISVVPVTDLRAWACLHHIAAGVFGHRKVLAKRSEPLRAAYARRQFLVDHGQPVDIGNVFLKEGEAGIGHGQAGETPQIRRDEASYQMALDSIDRARDPPPGVPADRPQTFAPPEYEIRKGDGRFLQEKQ